MASWRAVLDSGAHPVMGYYCRGYTFGIRLRVTIMIREGVLETEILGNSQG
jgi:hypothetical protein